MTPFERWKLIRDGLDADASHEDYEAAWSAFIDEFHALAHAVTEADVARTVELLAGGASPNNCDIVQSPALHIAAAMGHIELMTILLDAGADIDGRDYCQMTPLIQAANTGVLAAVTFLLSRGANPTLTSDAGYTAAMRVPGGAQYAPLRQLLRSAETEWKGRN